MLLEVEELTGWKRRLRIALPEDKVGERIGELFSRLRETVEIPGFRKGRAPQSILESRFGATIRQDAIRSLASDALMDAIKEKGLRPIHIQAEEEYDIETTPRDGSYHVSAMLELRPEIELTGYKGLEFEERVPVVADDDVAAALSELQEQHADLASVTRAGVKGDYVFIDYERLDESGNVVPDSSNTDYPCEVGAGLLPPEFDEALVGAAVGNEKTIAVRYPDDYRAEELAGREISFRVRVKDVREKRLPPINDDFARTVGRFETLLDLRVKIRTALEAQAKAAGRRRLEEEIVAELIKRHPFELPEAMVVSKLDQIYQRLSSREDVAKSELDEDEVRKAYRPIVEAQLKAALILGAIAEKEEITVSEHEIKTRVTQIAEQSDKDPVELAEALKGTEALSRLEDEIWLGKVHDYLVGVSKIETKFVEPSKEAKPDGS